MIEAQDFWELLKDPKLARAIVQSLCRSLRDRERRISTLLAEGARSKIAEALSYLSHRRNGLMHQMTQVEIAMFTGLSKEAVCKKMKPTSSSF